MTLTKKRVLGGAGIAALLLATSAIVTMDADASDHAEAPAATARPSADISDFYVWSENGNTTAIITVNPLTAAGTIVEPDPDVVYGFHFDTDNDYVADIDYWVRFGQNGAGDWGMQVTGPDGDMVGPVGQVTDMNGMKMYSGTTDDPFFFDLEGFNATLMTGDLSFDNTRDSIAGYNVMSIAIQVPTESIHDTSYRAWATTGAI